jgi:hypothetical protein
MTRAIITDPVAPSRPARRHLAPIRFRRDRFAVLAPAAAELRAHSAEEDSVVVGNVVRLYRESGQTPAR